MGQTFGDGMSSPPVRRPLECNHGFAKPVVRLSRTLAIRSLLGEREARTALMHNLRAAKTFAHHRSSVTGFNSGDLAPNAVTNW